MKYKIPEEFKENYFYKNRKEIKKISKDNKVDVGVALDMFRADHQNKYTSAELLAWNEMVIRFEQMKDANLSDLFK